MTITFDINPATIDARRREILEAADSLTARLYLWHPVDRFCKTVESLDKLAGDLEGLRSTKVRAHRERAFGPFREAWVLSALLRACQADRARLVPQGFGLPDAEIKVRGQLHQVEITESLEPDWRPNVRLETEESDGGPDDWRARVKQIPAVLAAAANRKVRKPYAKSSVLLVYLDILGTYGIGSEQAEAAITEFIDLYSGQFKGVRVLWAQKLY